MSIKISDNRIYSVISDSPEYTEYIGSLLAEKVKTSSLPCFVALYGDLGAGKTAFVRGFTSLLSPKSRVKSPSYTIVNEYRHGSIPVFHFDFYRLESSDELYGIGYDEYITNGICIAEWCEKIPDAVPNNAVKVSIEKIGDTERRITVTPDIIRKTGDCTDVDIGI